LAARRIEKSTLILRRAFQHSCPVAAPNVKWSQSKKGVIQASSPYRYRASNLIERFFNEIK
jgi:hypothetical protein